ncbi:hypothetical protein ACQEU5_13910 [Marinactinospora thermotolerans]|uniref:hypothetical protein n=1 Tax=Marinactinospora thermotolerans TaxID=531310 RepID=UPI003D922446
MRWWPPSIRHRPRGVHGALLSTRSFGDARNLPAASLGEHAEDTPGTLISHTLGSAPSISAVRRVARQNGLRLIRDSADGRRVTPLAEGTVQRTFGAVVGEAGVAEGSDLYLKVGRKVARIDL